MDHLLHTLRTIHAARTARRILLTPWGPQFRPACRASIRSLSTDFQSQRTYTDSTIPFVNSEGDRVVPEEDSTDALQIPEKIHRLHLLPVSCPGCGALTQDVENGAAGYYSFTRRAVRDHVKLLRKIHRRALGGEDKEHQRLIDAAAASEPSISGTTIPIHNEEENVEEHIETSVLPTCDRCHALQHDSKGEPIAHPSIEDIADSIAESPFSKNHIYHVVDAADFPMSVIPSIYRSLSVARPRTQNRRSPHAIYTTKPGLSFIITRSDLLGPTKEMVDRMMPKIITILRSSLGRFGEKLRLGNVHLVSSKRGWWTKGLKDDIWDRGGGNWLVGKFNVGKSNLFEVIFPKGSNERAPSYADLEQVQRKTLADTSVRTSSFQEDSLLPPPQPETPFPVMPLVSSLPGTTASPIRLPFGNHRGELIDLPGLERSGLDRYVEKSHKLDLVMTSRPKVYQHKIKPGQSLLLGGGLVRITPRLDENDPSTIIMAYPFVPLKAHVTATEKAIGTQAQERESGIESILAEDVGTSMKSAGTFTLETDVTKDRAGSMVRAGVDPSRLPFQVFATDVLIEGVGWVELVCQVRKRRHPFQPRRFEETSNEEVIIPETSTQGPQTTDTTVHDVVADHPATTENNSENSVPTSDLSIPPASFLPFNESLATNTGNSASDDMNDIFPQVEIFTPNGMYISQRPCLGLWQTWNSGKASKQLRTARPRKPMSGAKKREKQAARSAASKVE